MPPPHVVAHAAHIAATTGASDADALNAASLAAAQAGRNYWNAALLQPGKSVLDALTPPPTTTTTA
jgi:hypothetical protein